MFLDTLYDDKYFQVVESYFPYLFKYLISFAIIAKSKKFTSKLKECFSKNKDELEKDIYVQLFFAIFIDFDNDAAYDLIQKCKDLMKEDYFLKGYFETFAEKAKEILIENHILLNQTISFETFKKFFKDNEENKKYLLEIIKANYPNAKVSENKDGLEVSRVNKENQIYYKNQIDSLWKSTEQMIYFIEESEK